MKRSMILSNFSSSSSVVPGIQGSTAFGLRSELQVFGGAELGSSAGRAGEKAIATASDMESTALLRLSFPKGHHQCTRKGGRQARFCDEIRRQSTELKALIDSLQDHVLFAEFIA